VVGICGGHQMLGRSVADPDGVESSETAEGFGLLNVATRLLTNKVTRLVEVDPLQFDVETSSSVRGHFIHMGRHSEVMQAPIFTYVLHVLLQINRNDRVMNRRTVPSVQTAWFGERTFMGCSTGPVLGGRGSIVFTCGEACHQWILSAPTGSLKG